MVHGQATFIGSGLHGPFPVCEVDSQTRSRKTLPELRLGLFIYREPVLFFRLFDFFFPIKAPIS